MKSVIYKYKIPVPEEFGSTVTVEIPYGYKILKVGSQIITNVGKDKSFKTGEMFLWAQIDPLQPETEIRLRVFPTGQPFSDEGLKFLETVMMENGLVLHVYLEVQ